MKTFYEVQQLLKKYGTIIYIGDRTADLEMMLDELKELHNSKLIETLDYQTSVLILRQEMALQVDKNAKKSTIPKKK